MSLGRSNLKARVQRANQNNVTRFTDSYNQEDDRINKFARSRKQCDIEIEDHIKLLTEYRYEMDDTKKGRAKEALKTFENNYDKYMNQILKEIRDILQNNKKRLMQTILSDRQRELGNEKQIKRNIDQQILELKEMKKGLGTENFKEYIAKVVIYDFDYETRKIKESMSRLSYENVHLRIDEKKKQCYRNDMQGIIICQEYDIGDGKNKGGYEDKNSTKKKYGWLS